MFPGPDDSWGVWLPLCSIEKLPTRHTGGEDILRPEGLWEVCPSDHRVSQSVRVIRASLWQRILLQCRKLRFNSWVGKIPWRRDRLPTPVFLGFPYGSAVKNPPAMRKIWVRSLSWVDSLEKGKATHSSILPWRIPWIIREAKSQTRLSDFHSPFHHFTDENTEALRLGYASCLSLWSGLMKPRKGRS